jgi:DUF1009 family protein
MPAQIKTVGVLAGEGEIPHMLINHCIGNHIPVCTVQFKGCTYSRFPNIPTLNTRMERVGDIFRFLKSNNVSDIVLIGNLSRPSISSLRPDLKGIKTLAKIGKAFVKGDDNLLRSLKSEIENEGFTICGVDYFLGDLTLTAGTHTQTAPEIDYQVGVHKSIQHGLDDKGQSILMHVDGTFSFEDRNGTTALILDKGRIGSVLIKTTKPQQDPDLDRPTVGIETLEALYKTQGAGMIIQANSVFAVHKNSMIEYANKHNLSIEAIHV